MRFAKAAIRIVMAGKPQEAGGLVREETCQTGEGPIPIGKNAVHDVALLALHFQPKAMECLPRVQTTSSPAEKVF